MGSSWNIQKPVTNVGPLNLGWCFFPSEVASGSPLFLAVFGPIWQNFWLTFDLWAHQTCIKFQPQWSTDGQDDANFVGNSCQPKFKGQSLYIELVWNHKSAYPASTLMTAQCERSCRTRSASGSPPDQLLPPPSLCMWWPAWPPPLWCRRGDSRVLCPVVFRVSPGIWRLFFPGNEAGKEKHGVIEPCLG